MFEREIYINRRNRLKNNVSSGIALFLGNNESPCNYSDNCYGFRQDSSFLYFFGLDIPSLAATVDLDSGVETIYGDDVDIADIIWTGPLPSIGELSEKVGVGNTRPLHCLEEDLLSAVKAGRKIHFLPQYRHDNQIFLHEALGIPFSSLKETASTELIKAVVELRLVKEPCEIAELDKASNLGYAMHYAAMKAARPGMVEKEVVAIMESVAAAGGPRMSFPTILSQHGETMHNHGHEGILTPGRLLLIDAGCEIESNYCSDNTRTIPVGGKFSSRQADIYTIVSTANNYVLDAARPGITYRELHLDASRIILKGLSNLGLVHGDLEEMLEAGVQGLFMPHGLGHNMGLDVHDMEGLGENLVGYDPGQTRASQLGLGSLRMARSLRPGYVVTDEPGIYFIPALIEKWKAEGHNARFINFGKLEEYYDFGGIRLEDDLLITGNGARLLGSRRLPITVEEVERQMQ